MGMPFTQPPNWIFDTHVISTDTAGQVTDEAVRPRRAMTLDFVPVEPVPIPIFTNPVEELEKKLKAGAEEERRLLPALVAAREKWERAGAVLRHYAKELASARFAADQAQSEASATSPHSPQGIKEQRQAHARTLRAELADAQAEYDAAGEESRIAEAGWRDALAAHTARVEASKAQR